MKVSKIQYILTCLFMTASCEKLVEINPPQDYLISTTIFESDETAISATTGIYATMMKSDFQISYNISLFTGLYSDELDYNQSVSGLITLNTYSLIPQDALTNSFWNNGFNYIYQANAIIEGLGKSSKVSPAIRNQLLGEVLFIRAFWNYYLSNFYGPIPMIISTDYERNSKLSRVNVETIQKQIIADLLAAKQLLSDKYVAANSFSESNDRIRPNTYVASALLARVYLLLNEFAKAEEETTRIILDSKYDISDLATVFKRNSKEPIWQLELPTNTNYSNSYEANMFTLTNKPSPIAISQSSTLSQNLISLFGPSDKRRTEWIGTFDDNTVTPSVQYYYPAKFKTRSIPADEYTTPFRLGEIYLIRAEARSQLGLITDAIKDVDKIRSRAGLDLLKDLNPGISKQDLLDSIDVERRRELFCEWGSRWTDIRRSNVTDELMRVVAGRKGILWKSTAALWPIPLSEVLNSAKKIEQNEGYN